MWPSWIHAGVALLVLLTLLLTALAALLLWRDGYTRGWRAARARPPICLQCGYNLSGLTHCRCPECGREYTLESLWRTPSAGMRPSSAALVDAPREMKTG